MALLLLSLHHPSSEVRAFRLMLIAHWELWKEKNLEAMGHKQREQHAVGGETT
jgi:hypothetical protein